MIERFDEAPPYRFGQYRDFGRESGVCPATREEFCGFVLCVLRVIISGRKSPTCRFSYRCRDCGRTDRLVRKADLPERDRESALVVSDDLRAEWSYVWGDGERGDAHDRWRKWYQRYLASDVWKRKRALVMNRARYTCESCLVVPAVDIHHISYERAGCESLFDLRAVCKGCHMVIHNRMQWL